MTMREFCPSCEADTEHAVRVEVLQENTRTDTEGHSKEPYRVSECTECGLENQMRMNNA